MAALGRDIKGVTDVDKFLTLTNGPRAWKSLAQRGSSIIGTKGAPKRGSPGAMGAKGIVAPGHPAATLTIAGTGASSLIPANVNGAPFSSRFV